MLAVCPEARHQQLAPSGYTEFSQNTKCAESCCCISEQHWRAPCATVLSCANNWSQCVCCACGPVWSTYKDMCVHAAICEYLPRIYLCVCVCVCHRQGFFLSSSTNKHHGCQRSGESHQTNPLWDRLTMCIFKSKYTVPVHAAAHSTTVNDFIFSWFDETCWTLLTCIEISKYTHFLRIPKKCKKTKTKNPGLWSKTRWERIHLFIAYLCQRCGGCGQWAQTPPSLAATKN